MFEIANYNHHGWFFLSPHNIFNNLAAISNLEQISHIPLSEEKSLLDHRQLTIIPPWKEKLGYKTGYLFNRIATFTPEHKEINEWIDINFKELINNYLSIE